VSDPQQASPEQLQALDTLIDAMERGEITPSQVATEIKAAPPPVNQQQQQGSVDRIVRATVSITVTMATIVTLVAGAEESDEIRTVEDLPDEISLEDLLEVRRRLTSA
jgi:hypothetical protein